MGYINIIIIKNIDEKDIDKILNVLESEKEIIVDEHQLHTISSNDLLIKSAERKVYYKGKDVYLTTMEFNVLYYLVIHKNKLCTPQQIYEAVAKDHYIAGDYIIKNIIYKIRKKLTPEIIRTVRDMGYQYVG